MRPPPDPRPSVVRRPLRFAVAGVVGFVVDGAVLMLGLWAGLPAWAARVPSFLLAVVATWTINRSLTFQTSARPTLREFGAYLAAMSLGFAVNYGAYLGGLVLGLPPLGALALSSALAMVLNYLNAKRVLGRG